MYSRKSTYHSEYAERFETILQKTSHVNKQRIRG